MTGSKQTICSLMRWEGIECEEDQLALHYRRQKKYKYHVWAKENLHTTMLKTDSEINFLIKYTSLTLVFKINKYINKHASFFKVTAS